MKKAANADIRNLFRKFGGDTGSYQEIQQDYVIDKAQKTWPIVTAIEKERVNAPSLKATAANPASRVSGSPDSPGSATGSFAAQPGAPVARRVAPVASQNQPVSGAQTGSLSAIFAKPAVQPVAERSLFAALNTPKPAEQAPVERSLFGALNGAPKPAEQTPVARSLFAALNSTAKPVAAQAVQFGTQAQTDAQRTENDQVALVFSRLRNPQSNGAASSPDKDLRSLFGFLKK
ncbi:MAG: BcsR/BcsP family cellulose biosynthesis protein [Gallionella sp.]